LHQSDNKLIEMYRPSLYLSEAEVLKRVADFRFEIKQSQKNIYFSK